MIKKWAIFITTVITIMNLPLFAAVPSTHKEAGLCTHDAQSEGITWDFIRYFTYEKYYYTVASNWTTNNNNSTWGVDAYDFSYFCGHGSPYVIHMDAGDALDLRNAGDNSNNGYGTNNLEFLVLHSCSVVPSPIDVTDWWTPWIGEPGGIFDGLHILMGFRTEASYSNANMIASYMGELTNNQSGRVWENWVNAVNTKGASGSRDEFCFMSAFRTGYSENPSYNAAYDVYGGSISYDTSDPQLWCFWSE